MCRGDAVRPSMRTLAVDGGRCCWSVVEPRRVQLARVGRVAAPLLHLLRQVRCGPLARWARPPSRAEEYYWRSATGRA
jgi:hypothetical protein